MTYCVFHCAAHWKEIKNNKINQTFTDSKTVGRRKRKQLAKEVRDLRLIVENRKQKCRKFE